MVILFLKIIKILIFISILCVKDIRRKLIMDIIVVLVTFNRLKDLKITLDAWDQQTEKPRNMIIVDNKSTDGTISFLEQWKKKESGFKKEVIELPENIGGAGGFYEGMKMALNISNDWVFVSDDDAIPRDNMIEKIKSFVTSHDDLIEQCSAICTGVYNEDHFSGIHRCRIEKSIIGFYEKPVKEEEYQKEYFPIDIYSFVGTFIRKSALKQAGLPERDFFIYNDDYEHAVRVGKTGKMICVPSSVIYHIDNLKNDKYPTWRDYYATRNGVIMHRKHFGIWGGLSRSLRRFGMAVISGNFIKMKLIITGIKDGYEGKQGLHPIYKPGWNPKQKIQ